MRLHGREIGLACALVLAGCTGKHAPTAPTTPKKPAVVASTAPARPLDVAPRTLALGQSSVTLTGKVKLLSDQGGALISDASGGILSDAAAGIISNNAGALISDNGGGLIANNGGGLISSDSGSLIANNGGGVVANNGGKFALLATKQVRSFYLADAVIGVYDASGAQLVDEAGKPVTVTTDKTGAYTITAKLPPQNLVLRIKLWQGGELSALLPHQDTPLRQQPIDTASSVGARYVLDQYVKGQQAVYEKLPATEAERLHLDLLSSQGLLGGLPSYQPTELVGLGDQLRQKAPVVDRVFSDIQALLLGQSSLGNGRKATEVPLQEPRGLALDAAGNLYVGESGVGRVRKVAPDGTLTTYADGQVGQVKQNFPRLGAMAMGRDGALYVASASQVWRLGTDGQVKAVAGTGNYGFAALGGPATGIDMFPRSLAVAADGTLLVGEVPPANESGDIALAFSLGADGLAKPLAVPASWVNGTYLGLAPMPGGDLAVVGFGLDGTNSTKLYRVTPDGQATVISAEIAGPNGIDTIEGLVVAPDGTVYVPEDIADRVSAFAPDGTRRIVAGVGAPAGASELGRPGSLALGPDGTLYVADPASNVVRALGPDGSWRIVAGMASGLQIGDGGSLGINTPAGAAVDAQGRLLISESGGNVIARYDGQSLQTIAGHALAGSGGDGGPATSAGLDEPGPLAMHGGDLYLLDVSNQRLRKIAPDGTITTVAGGATTPAVLDAAHPSCAAFDAPLHEAAGLAIDAAGRVYWCSGSAIYRLSADGKLTELVAGTGGGLQVATALVGTIDGPRAALGAPLALPTGLAFDAQGRLYVCDVFGMGIRRIEGLDTATPTIRNVAGISLGAIAQRGQEGGGDPEGVDALSAALVAPAGLCFDAAGNLYFSEAGTVSLPRISGSLGAQFKPSDFGLPVTYPRVRKLSPDGKITSVAGPGGLFFTDPQAPDALVAPSTLLIDQQGRMVIIDAGANLVRYLPAGSF